MTEFLTIYLAITGIAAHFLALFYFLDTEGYL
jgi:hypothetical protein